MRLATSRRIALALVTLLSLSLTTPAQAVPNINAVRAQIERLQQDAADASEGANDARVRLSTLRKRLAGVEGQQARQSKQVDQLRAGIGRLALDAYINGGLGEGIGLLFSDDPTAYLNNASSLEALSRSQRAALRKYTTAVQSLARTSLVVSDQVRLVAATEQEWRAKAASARTKLRQAERLLATLTAEERRRLQAAEDADAAERIRNAKGLLGKAAVSPGRAGIAIRFAIKQIGDRYVFGAAGPNTWDCSGLTMMAYRAAGVSLPHSSKAQIGYGRKVSRAALQPGDLVFFYRPISHVGIYIGGGKMLHAPRPGKTVTVTDIGGRWYAGAVRL